MNKQIKRIKPPVYYDKDQRMITDQSGKLFIEVGISRKADDGVYFHHQELYQFTVDAINEKLKTIL